MDAVQKLEAMKRGQTVVTCDSELDAMLRSGDAAAYEVRTIHNADRVGTKDMYLGWIGGPSPN